MQPSKGCNDAISYDMMPDGMGYMYSCARSLYLTCPGVDSWPLLRHVALGTRVDLATNNKGWLPSGLTS